LPGAIDESTTKNPTTLQAPTLRDYQIVGVEEVRGAFREGARRICYVLPTGGGKTVLFVYIVASASARGKRTLILAHRVELLDQGAAALQRAGVDYGFVAPGYPESDALVQVASVATLAQPRRLERWRGHFDFVVIDEAHHAVAGSWAKVLASQPRAKILGVSATPERLDGRGLVEQFDVLIEDPPPAALTETGWLSRSICYEPTAAPDLSDVRIRAGDYAIEELRARMDGVVIGAAVREYQRLCPGVPAVAFCVGIDHSRAVAEAFNASGVRAVHLDGDTPAAERRAAIAGIGDGELKVLCNCGLISEGLDIPGIVAIIMVRPTASLALYLQMVGRGLRPAPNKEKAIILDFAGNCSRHGLPDAPREWTLDAKSRRQRERSDGPRLRRCPGCSALNRAGTHECAECGADLRTPKERIEIEMRLREAARLDLEAAVAGMRRREQWEWAGADEGRLRVVARLNRYKPGWVFRRMQEIRQGAAIWGTRS
jgi:superfamily II DNA or RNA helicase